MFEVRIEGFDNFRKKLDDLQQNIKNLKREKIITFNELFTQDFIKTNTSFESLEDMFNQSGFTINSQEDFQKILGKEWDNFIANKTKFKNWREILAAAEREWVRRKLGF